MSALPPDQNPARPEGEGGLTMLERMNGGRHAMLSAWSFTQLSIDDTADAIDIGCGGGANVARLLERCPRGSVTGVDYASTSVDKSRSFNARAIAQGSCRIVEGDVMALPFADASFDVATAFETVYFWPDIRRSLSEVARVLRRGGTFMISNEVDGTAESDREMAASFSGMSMYTGNDLAALLKEAGFDRIEVRTHPSERWMVVLARRA